MQPCYLDVSSSRNGSRTRPSKTSGGYLTFLIDRWRRNQPQMIWTRSLLLKQNWGGRIKARVITLYHLDMVLQQKQREEHQNHKANQKVSEATKAPAETRDPPARIPEITWRKPSRHNSSHIVTSKQTTTKPCRNESGEKKGETDSETWADVRNDEGAPTTHRARSESAQ